MFYVAYRKLLVMFCVLKFYFVDFYGMFTSSPTWCLKMHVLCKVRKNIIFQNKILLVLYYRHNKTFWYQFCNFKHILKAENSEDSLASSCVEFSIGLSCNPVWDWATVGTTLYYSRYKSCWPNCVGGTTKCFSIKSESCEFKPFLCQYVASLGKML